MRVRAARAAQPPPGPGTSHAGRNHPTAGGESLTPKASPGMSNPCPRPVIHTGKRNKPGSSPARSPGQGHSAREAGDFPVPPRLPRGPNTCWRGPRGRASAAVPGMGRAPGPRPGITAVHLRRPQPTCGPGLPGRR